MSFNTEQSAHQSLRSIVSERTTQLVFWVGAGISKQAGLPLWFELREALQNALEADIATYDGNDALKKENQLNAIRSNNDIWTAFQMLEDALGPETFRSLIRELLAPAATVKPPHLYNQIWKTGCSGVVSLNIDRLTTRAYMGKKDIAPIEFNGFQAKNISSALKSPYDFILNLHGQHEDSHSWVFTRKKLNALMGQPGFSAFIQAVFMARTNIFCGLTLNDIAIRSHLERALKDAPECGPHFWITDRKDEAITEWAETHQVRIIRYRNGDGEHRELDELFDDLLQYTPKDEDQLPVFSQRELFSDGGIPSPDDLATKPAEEIRNVLNFHAKAILTKDSNDRYNDFETFCETYAEAIWRAWFVDTAPGRNQLLGYELKSKMASGAFGTVYESLDNDGNRIAVKVLHESVRHDPRVLQSFRRGVSSMRILAKSDVPGMVSYRDASEIPAFVVMDFIDGPNLKVAKNSGFIEDWNDRLEVAVQLTEIIDSAHRLPQRVLHRDIRPPNVMLKDYFENGGSINVVVLDFDLSWHLGASEKSVIMGASTTGYLAPEQLVQRERVSTRHALVDAFGLGMTFFFMASGNDPMPAQHNHSGWEKLVYQTCHNKTCISWKSAPSRFARVIINATRDKQSARWDIRQILEECRRIREAVSNPTQVEEPDLLIDEVLFRSVLARQYHWSQDKLCATANLDSGMHIELVADLPNRLILLKTGWMDSGGRLFKDVRKWIPKTNEQACSSLTKNGFKILRRQSSGQEFSISASIAAQKVTQDIASYSYAVDDLVDKLSFK